jgi:ATP-dependent RNA helicase DeaD
LAVQVKDEFSHIGRYKRIRCTAVFGKQPMTVQIRELKQRVHVVVGTPGRVYDHIERGNLELKDIKYFVIDEADKMLNMGFIDQMEAIIKLLPMNRVTMLFSATIPEKIEALCNQYMQAPIKIEIEHENKASENISQYYHEIEESNKFKLLCKVIYTERPDYGVVFLNTKDGVEKLATSMRYEGFSCMTLHGGMEQVDRLAAMKSFKNGEFNLLVATDVAARGIHIDDITHVINYDIPLELESYVHRIGRTGRVGNKGIAVAITFVTPFQKRFLEQIENFVGYKIENKIIPSEEECEEGKKLFKKKAKKVISSKNDRDAKLNKDIIKIYINAGKKKKIRPGDIVGAITNIEGICMEDIGIIDIQENISYVDILRNKGEFVIKELEKGTLKGKKVKVQKATQD